MFSFPVATNATGKLDEVMRMPDFIYVKVQEAEPAGEHVAATPAKAHAGSGTAIAGTAGASSVLSLLILAHSSISVKLTTSDRRACLSSCGADPAAVGSGSASTPPKPLTKKQQRDRDARHRAKALTKEQAGTSRLDLHSGPPRLFVLISLCETCTHADCNRRRSCLQLAESLFSSSNTAAVCYFAGLQEAATLLRGTA